MSTAELVQTTDRLIAIGDIHGCVHALESIVEAINPTASDTIVVLGDFIDYGRESAEVVNMLLALQQQTNLVTLLGNHEEMLLGALADPSLTEAWLMVGGQATISSYKFGGSLKDVPDEHLAFIRRCRDWYETSDFAFTHANYWPNLPLEEQPGSALRWELLLEPYPEPHASGKTFVVGHTEQKSGDVLNLGHIACIDTYCRGYGWLTAWDLTSGHLWQASRWGQHREGESIASLKRARRLLQPTAV